MMASPRSFLMMFLAATSVWACSGEPLESSEGDGAATQHGAAPAGSAGAESAGGAGASNDDTMGDAGGGRAIDGAGDDDLVCDYPDESSAGVPVATFTIRNVGTEPLYFPVTSCDRLLYPEVSDEEGTQVHYQQGLTWDDCDRVRESGSFRAPAIHCAQEALTLLPGDAATANWNGMRRFARELDDLCFSSDAGPERRCFQRLRADSDATYTVSVTAYASYACRDTADPCTPTRPWSDVLPAGKATTATRTFTFGEDVTLELSLD